MSDRRRTALQSTIFGGNLSTVKQSTGYTSPFGVNGQKLIISRRPPTTTRERGAERRPEHGGQHRLCRQPGAAHSADPEHQRRCHRGPGSGPEHRSDQQRRAAGRVPPADRRIRGYPDRAGSRHLLVQRSADDREPAAHERHVVQRRLHAVGGAQHGRHRAPLPRRPGHTCTILRASTSGTPCPSTTSGSCPAAGGPAPCRAPCSTAG